MKLYPILFSIFLWTLFSCGSSTTTTETTPTPPKPPVVTQPEVPLSPCTKFSDVSNGEELLENYVISRDYIKLKDYDAAFPLWQKVYNGAPAADGQRNTVFTDGIKIYEHYISQETDPEKKEILIDKVFSIYQKMDTCYGENGYVPGKMAFDLYYKYPDRSTNDEIYSLFKQSFDRDGEDAYFFIINPFTAVMIQQLNDEKITLQQAQADVDLINKTISKGLSSGKNSEQWAIVDEYTASRFEGLEGVENFYDCDYYKNKYYVDFQENNTDCETIEATYARLRWGKCPLDDAMVREIGQAKATHCRVVVNDPSPKCRDFLSEGKYRDAIRCYEEKMNASSDSERQASYALIISKIYYAHLKNFPQARKYALKAADYKSGWGEPYILIGKLYASSGPLCGPGRGFDSQIVTWPAIDMWNRAKRVDPSVAAEANKNIARYRQYMPSKEDIFLRGLKEGDSFRVGCWIQENTTVRVAP